MEQFTIILCYHLFEWLTVSYKLNLEALFYDSKGLGIEPGTW